MKYEYRDTANASKLLYAKDIRGLPSDISLIFNSAHIRLYKSLEMNNYFHCTLAIPSILDDEGYVLELDFLSNINSSLEKELNSNITQLSDSEFDVWKSENKLDSDFCSTYLAPLNDHSFDSLPKSVSCWFEEETDMGQRMLLLNMKIEGTPFSGYAFIDRSLYTV